MEAQASCYVSKKRQKIKREWQVRYLYIDIVRTGMFPKGGDPYLLHSPKIFTEIYNESTMTFTTPELGF